MFVKIKALARETTNRFYLVVLPFYIVIILIIPLIILGIVIGLFQGKGFSENLNQIYDILKVLGAILSLSFSVLVPYSICRYLVERAINSKNSYIYNFVEIVYGLCILVVVFSIGFFTLLGVGRLYREQNFFWLGAFIISVVFSVYYWIKKNDILSKCRS
jgi:hypothetical protein